jgi:hypothetical protein
MPGDRRQGCAKAPIGSGQPRRPPARLRKGCGKLRAGPATAGKVADRVSEALGTPWPPPANCGKAQGGSGQLRHRRPGCGKASGGSGQPWRPPARLRKGFGKLRAAQMHVIHAANELQADIAHGRRGKSSASLQKHCKLQRLTVNRAISHRVLARGSQNHCNLQHLAVNFAISHEVLAGGSQNHCNLQHVFAPGRGRGLAPEQCRMNLQALTGLGFRVILYTSGLTAGIRRGSGIESGTAYRRSVKGNSNGSSYAICSRCAVALSLSARSARSDRAKCAWNSEPREEFRV